MVMVNTRTKTWKWSNVFLFFSTSSCVLAWFFFFFLIYKGTDFVSKRLPCLWKKKKTAKLISLSRSSWSLIPDLIFTSIDNLLRLTFSFGWWQTKAAILREYTCQFLSGRPGLEKVWKVLVSKNQFGRFAEFPVLQDEITTVFLS